MYELFYRIEVNVICLVILNWVMFQMMVSNDKQTKNILFRRTMLSSMWLLTVEVAQLLVNGHPGAFLLVLNYVLSIIYLSLNGLMAYHWFMYTLHYVGGIRGDDRWLRRALFLLVVAFAVLLCLSPWTRWIFFVEPQANRFVHGRLYFIQAVVTYGFFTAAALVAFGSVFVPGRRNHSVAVTLGAFVLLPLAGGVAHLIFPAAKIVWQMLALAQFFVFCDFKFSLISVDDLTGLNNRRSFDSAMEQLAQDSPGDARPFLFMMDVNLFKDINDVYGHPEGDAALVQVASLLKGVFRTVEAYLCRYGGDEFAAVYTCDAAEAESLRQRVYDAFDDYNKSSGKPYLLTMSIGYARKDGNGKEAVARLLQEADAALYREKALAHGRLGVGAML